MSQSGVIHTEYVPFNNVPFVFLRCVKCRYLTVCFRDKGNISFHMYFHEYRLSSIVALPYVRSEELIRWVHLTLSKCKWKLVEKYIDWIEILFSAEFSGVTIYGSDCLLEIYLYLLQSQLTQFCPASVGKKLTRVLNICRSLDSMIVWLLLKCKYQQIWLPNKRTEDIRIYVRQSYPYK